MTTNPTQPKTQPETNPEANPETQSLTPATSERRLALVTGATGYIGGKLVTRLTDAGWRVRVLTRDSAKTADRAWGSLVRDQAGPGQVEVVEGDAGDPEALTEALLDVDVAWYLLHSMGGDTEDFAEQERSIATAFATAAAACHVGRIVYLGGLHPKGELSEHLASRVEVGEILLGSGVPTAALQAGVVLGDESASFVMLRHLSERLPGAIAPDWVGNHIQPIAIDDVLHYLVAAADLPPQVSRTFDVAGPDVVTYADMMRRYARTLGLLPRVVLTAPVTTPRLASHWIGLVTPVRADLARPLIGSLVHDTVAHESDLDDLVGPPPGGASTFEEAVERSVAGLDTHRWHKTVAATSAAVLATAVVGSLATDPRSRWYDSLVKPSFQPPTWAFPVAWTLLYADIAVVSALALADLAETGRDDERRRLEVALGTNLALNAGWSILFFRGHALRASTVEAVALAASSADLVRRVAKAGPQKGVVLAPYAGWTAFAAVLTGSIAWLNRRRR